VCGCCKTLSARELRLCHDTTALHRAVHLYQHSVSRLASELVFTCIAIEGPCSQLHHGVMQGRQCVLVCLLQDACWARSRSHQLGTFTAGYTQSKVLMSLLDL
jgi:hypothetical protein